MFSPYGLEIIESCLSCKMRGEHTFCDLSRYALQELEKMILPTTYPRGAVLFVEGQTPRGLFVLCRGRVKLSISSREGKIFILKVAQAGEVLGLGATVSGKGYDLCAETIDPCQVNFIKRTDFLRFMKEQPEVCFRVAELLSQKYNHVFHEIRSLLMHSPSGKLARLLQDWISRNGAAPQEEPRLTFVLTRDEIAQKIGTSRGTVTRVLRDLKQQEIIQPKGATVLIRNKAALRSMAAL
ncbi:MAG TPA: Crp/Fnr family transcriptional regulator [Terriglobales bacterium]|nr:Crp/Fnr family transcriptional regulator [Terriglobales bacterium]